MWITSTYQLIIRSLAPSPETAPFDSFHGRVIRNQQKLVSYTPPTAAVKLLQYSGLGSNTGMGFHPTNDSHECLKMERLLFGFLDLVKNRGGWLFTGQLKWFK